MSVAESIVRQACMRDDGAATDSSPAFDPRQQAYYQAVGFREPPSLAALRARIHELGPVSSMQIAPGKASLLALLVRLTGARHVLEIGTFAGYSALAMALALPEDGRLVTCEKSTAYLDIARAAWNEAAVSGRIDLRVGRAIDTLAALRNEGHQSFDLCFIDADKKAYEQYYEACLTMTRKGGLIAIDNTLWRGALVNAADQRASTVAIRRLNARIAADPRVEHVLVPFDDGLTLCRCRQATAASQNQEATLA